MQDRLKLRKVAAYLAVGGLLAAAWPVASQNRDSVINEADPLEDLAETQKQSLSADFPTRFRTLRDLSPKNVRAYLTERPREILAFRRYIVRLENQAIITTDALKRLVEVCVAVASENASLLAVSGTDSQNTNKLSVSDDTERLAQKRSIPSVPYPKESSRILNMSELNEDEEPAEAWAQIRELERQRQKERNIRLAAKIMSDLANSADKRKTIVDRVNASIGEFVEKEATDQVKPFLDNTRVSVQANNGAPEYELRGLKLLGDKNALGFGFTEFGLIRSDGTTTLNLGVGSRVSDPSNLVMIGANGVLDYEPTKKHSRVSVGVEAISKPFQLYANRYYVLSNPYQVNGTTAEYALNGRDIKLQAAVPYLPKTYLGVTDFKWYGENGHEDIEGARYTLDGYLGAGWSLELERTEFSSGQKPSLSGKLSYNYTLGSKPESGSGASVPFAFEPLPEHLKVGFINRQNLIAKQTTVNGLTVTFEKL
jgi:hypothetical protein